MAEPLVLAELTIDASGVQRGTAITTDQLGRIGSATAAFGSKATGAAGFTAVLVRQMFNLRRAATALLGTFTLAGLILIFVDLIAQIVSATEWFGKLTSAFTNLKEALIGGEDVFQRTIRNLQNLSKAGAISIPEVELLKQMGNVKEAIGAAIEERNKLTGVAGVEAERSLIDRSIFNLITQLEDLRAKMVEVRGEILKIESEPLEFPKIPFAKQPGAAPPDLFPGFFDATTSTFSLVGSQAEQLNTSLHDVLAGFHELGDVAPPTLLQIFEGFEKSKKSIESNKFAAEALNITMQAIGTAIVSSLLGGQKEGENLFKGIMRQIAAAMIVKGIEYTALGIAATTGFGAAAEGGSPHQFFAAAGKFFAAGAAAAIIAGTGGGRGGGAGAESTAEAQTVTRHTLIQVDISGPVFGGSRDEMIRNIAEGLRDALGDNLVIEPA